MKILLVLPKSPNSFLGGVSSGGKAGLARITLTTIAALCPDDVHVKIVDARVSPVNYDDDVDLVGITALTSEACHAYEIADNFRIRGITVVMGGVHVSARPEEALTHADAIVCGEAELSWPRLLEDFRNNRLKRGIYKSELLSDMGRVPVPRRSLLDKSMYTSFSTLQASRGCPFTCDFCSVTTFFGNTYRQRPVRMVIDEIKGLPDKRIFFMDDNIVGKPAYAIKLMEAMVPLKITWGAQASITLAKNQKVLDLYAKSGGRYAFTGFESISQKSLKNLKKGWNNVKEYGGAIRKIHGAGIDIIGSFIFGLDDDDTSTFREVLNFSLKNRLDAIHAYILTPFPGTGLYERLEKEGRIFDRDWNNYHAGQTVFRPGNMTSEELQNGYYWILKEFYSLPNVIKRIMRTPKNLVSRASLNFGYRKKALKLPRPSIKF